MTCFRSTSFEWWHVLSRDSSKSVPKINKKLKKLNSSADRALEKQANRSARWCHVRHVVFTPWEAPAQHPRAFVLFPLHPKSKHALGAPGSSKDRLSPTRKIAHTNKSRTHARTHACMHEKKKAHTIIKNETRPHKE